MKDNKIYIYRRIDGGYSFAKTPKVKVEILDLNYDDIDQQINAVCACGMAEGLKHIHMPVE